MGILIEWRGTGLDEVGFNVHTQQPLVFIDPRYVRPSEVDCLIGDASKAKEKLRWQHTISFDALIKEMVASDHAALMREQLSGNTKLRREYRCISDGFF